MEDAGDWVRVTAPWQPSSAGLPACSAFAGYPGWLPASHLATAAESAHDQALAVVTKGTARLRVATGKTMTVSWATTFPVIAVRDIAVHVALPEGRRGVLGVEHVALRPSGAAPAVAADAILASARRMVATGYLWGGTSGWGLDCSGLVHLAFRAAGLVVPRDAHDQQAAATAVAIDDTRPGDLYFFGPVGRASHVGLVSGRRTMLHAPETGQLVEEAPVNAERSLALTGAGRFGLSDETERVRMR
jgi:cell wall-associated NlpC family hydrolase